MIPLRPTSLLLALLAAATTAHAEGGVTVLTDATIDATLKDGKTWLVEFYAPWCGHCKALAPEWEKLGAKYADSESIGVAKLDCTAHKAASTRFGIRGFPTIKVVAEGQVYDYQGQRTVDSFSAWAEGSYEDKGASPYPEPGADAEEPAPASAVDESDVGVLDDKNFEHVVQANSGMTTGDWFIEFYAPWCGHCKSLKPTWAALATELKGEVNVAKIDATANKIVAGQFGVRGYPSLKMLSHGKVYEYKGARDVETMAKWALGEFKEEEGAPMPKPAFFGWLGTLVTEEVEEAAKDVLSIYSYRKEAGMLIFIFGFILAFLLDFTVGIFARNDNGGITTIVDGAAADKIIADAEARAKKGEKPVVTYMKCAEGEAAQEIARLRSENARLVSEASKAPAAKKDD